MGRSIQPGESDDVEISMAAGAHTGDFTKKVRVQTNDPNEPSPELTCKGKTLVAFKTDPPTLNFGRIERDSGPVTKTVTLTRGDGGPLDPKLGKIDPPVTAELREVEPGEKYALDITVSPPWPNEKVSGNVKIETGIEQAPEETIRLFGSVDPRLKTEPKSFVLPSNAEAEADLRVALVWAGTPGKAVGATATDRALTAKLVEEDGKQYVDLHVPANFEHKQKTPLSVSVVTDDPVVSTLRIPISPSSAAAASAEKAIARPAKLAPPAGPANMQAREAAQPQPTTQPRN